MIYLGIFIFLVCLLSLFRKKNTKQQKEEEEQFWVRENRANHTRRQDISTLPYINIPLENFPIDICKDEELQDCEKILKQLFDRQILNLVGLTNTDLKLKYGPANLDFLSDCEQNFITLCKTLVSYAARLDALGYTDEAQTILEYGIACGSDVSQNYLLLADIYQKTGRPERMENLLEHAEQLDSIMKNSIVSRLKKKQNGPPA